MSLEDEALPARRCCTNCRRELPLNAEHFHRHVRYSNGFRAVRKECRSRARKNARREQYGCAERTLIVKYARDIRAGVDLPSHEQLHYVLSQYLGGTEGIARSFAHHLQEAKPGCRTAVALIRTIVDLAVQEERRREQREEEQQTAVSQLTEEELRHQMERSMKAMLERERWEMVPKDSLCDKCRCIAS